MMNAIATLTGITILAWLFFLVDWMGRRSDRRKREGRT